MGQKKSTKSKSKRSSQKDRWKIQKKVKEHYRKQRREQKRKKREGIRPAQPKDPGVPSAWPFKKELQQEMETHKRQAQALNRYHRDRNSMLTKQTGTVEQQQQDHDVDMQVEGEEPSLAELSRQAQRRAAEFSAVERAAAGARTRSGTAATRAYFKEFKKVVQSSDIVLQVLDARDPNACRCENIEHYVRRDNPDRRIVLVLNKADLVPREALQQWLNQLREEAPTVVFKAAVSKSGDSKHAKGDTAKRPTESLKAEECLGVNTLLQLLKNFASKRAAAASQLTVGVVGLPNVGKSSLINSMKRSKAASTAASPGSTKAMQQVSIDSGISLLDSPGVVMSSPKEGEAAAALRNATAIDALEDPVSPVREIVRRCPEHQLMHVYNIPAFGNADDFLRLVAAQRGKLKKGGVPNVAEAARVVLKDWRNGAIPYYTLPPKQHFDELPYEDAQVVQSYSADFDANEVYKNEESLVIGKLPAKSERQDSQLLAQMPAGSKSSMDVHSLDRQVKADEALSEQQLHMRTYPSKTKAQFGNEATQTELLYGESNQHNPHLARAAKKRAKKDNGYITIAPSNTDNIHDDTMEEYDWNLLHQAKEADDAHSDPEEKEGESDDDEMDDKDVE